MNGTQYEEFCRLFLAEELEIPIEAIQSLRISSATHPDLSTYKNQIDFYWEKEDDNIKYVNIADAKWRGSDKVPINKVRELEQVKNDINAHKAMMITNADFTDGARSFAENKGIALHIVRPDFDYTTLNLDLKNREQIQAQLRQFFTGNKPPYSHKVVCKGVDSGTDAAGQSSTPSKASAYSKGSGSTHLNKMVQPRSYTQKVQGRQGGSRTGGRGGTVQKGRGLREVAVVGQTVEDNADCPLLHKITTGLANDCDEQDELTSALGNSTLHEMFEKG